MASGALVGGIADIHGNLRYQLHGGHCEPTAGELQAFETSRCLGAASYGSGGRTAVPCCLTWLDIQSVHERTHRRTRSHRSLWSPSRTAPDCGGVSGPRSGAQARGGSDSGGVRCRDRRGRHLRRSIVCAPGLAGCEVAINLATSLPAPGEQGDYAKNDQLRREGTPIFVRACREVGVSRVLQQSIAMTHAGGGDQWADETTFHPPGEGIAGAAIAAVRAMEAAVVESDLDWVILRGALFYGPGTGFDDDWFARARAGKLRLPARGQRLSLARSHRRHGCGDGCSDPTLAVAAAVDRGGRLPGAMARRADVRVRCRRQRSAAARRTRVDAFVPSEERTRTRAPRVGARVPRLSRGADTVVDARRATVRGSAGTP